MSNSPSFEMDGVTRFTTGTVGPKGQRTFYIQVSDIDETVSLKLEKQQVLALAEYLETMMTDLPAPQSAELPVDLELAEPVISEWVVASMGIAYSEAAERIVLWAEELVYDEVDDEQINPATARFQVSVAQAKAFIGRAMQIVGDGRPPCPYCNTPLNDDAGWCPCVN